MMNPMKAEDTLAINKICNLIKDKQDFLILVHEKPDGDAIGCLLALLLALKALEKNVTGIAETVPEQYRLLPGFEFLKTPEEYKKDDSVEICFILDSSNSSRTHSGLIPESTTIVNIDHHADNTMFGNINLVNSDAAAAGMLIFEILKGLDIQITSDITDNLYTAIITDTGRFGFSNTNADVFKVMADLVELGASPVRITNMIYKNYSFRRAMIFGKALNTIESHLEGKVVTMELPYETVEAMGIEPHETDGLVEYLQGIKDQDVSFLMKEFSPAEVRVSLRSRGTVDVMKIAGKYNGGGHKVASGCTMMMPLTEAKNTLIKECLLQLEM
jgi:phosphoesterase RecJ-like protein